MPFTEQETFKLRKTRAIADGDEYTTYPHVVTRNQANHWNHWEELKTVKKVETGCNSLILNPNLFKTILPQNKLLNINIHYLMT